MVPLVLQLTLDEVVVVAEGGHLRFSQAHHMVVEREKQQRRHVGDVFHKLIVEIHGQHDTLRFEVCRWHKALDNMSVGNHDEVARIDSDLLGVDRTYGMTLLTKGYQDEVYALSLFRNRRFGNLFAQHNVVVEEMYVLPMLGILQVGFYYFSLFHVVTVFVSPAFSVSTAWS